MENTTDNRTESSDSEDRPKKGLSTVLKITAGVVITIAVCVCGVSIYIVQTFNRSGAAAVLNPELAGQVSQAEQRADEVRDNYIFDSSPPKNEYLEGSGEFILLSQANGLSRSASIGNPNVYYLSLDEPELTWWVENEENLSNQELDSAAEQEVPAALDSKFLIFEDGRYKVFIGSEQRYAISQNGAYRAESSTYHKQVYMSSGPLFAQVSGSAGGYQVFTMAWDDGLLYFLDTQLVGSSDAKHTIYSVNPDGSNLTEVYAPPKTYSWAGPQQIAVIPGKSKLLFRADDELWLVDPAEQSADLIQDGKRLSEVLVSPDGKKIAYLVGNRNQSKIEVMELIEETGSGSLSLEWVGSFPESGSANARSNFIWSTDSDKIVFKHNDPTDGCYEVYEPKGGGAPGYTWRTKCLYTIAIWDIDRPSELTFPLDNYAFYGQIIGSFKR